MSKNSKRGVVIGAFLLVAVFAGSAFSTDIPFKYIDLKKVSRYHEDRIAFQHIERSTSPLIDNSLEVLLIIKGKKMFLIMDGYDDPAVVATKRHIMDMENMLIDDDALWVNRIDSTPNAVYITERRIDIMKSFDEKIVTDKFGASYKRVRDAFLKRHVDTFKQLMRNRKESGLIVERKPLPKPLYINAPKTETKYTTRVVAKTLDERIYYAEDADGDGITETFTVHLPDGFDWGIDSGPNIIIILDNKQKDIEAVIGKLATEAYNGTPEENDGIKQSFPSDSEIDTLIQEITPMVELDSKKKPAGQ